MVLILRCSGEVLSAPWCLIIATSSPLPPPCPTLEDPSEFDFLTAHYSRRSQDGCSAYGSQPVIEFLSIYALQSVIELLLSRRQSHSSFQRFHTFASFLQSVTSLI